MISVIIPVYSRQNQATEALKSALSQGELVLEVILVDDASPEPYKLPTEFEGDPRIHLLRLEQNGGAAAARNHGIKAARGEFIAFLDSDDLWNDGKLDAQIRFLNLHPYAKSLTCCVTGFRQIEMTSGHQKLRIPIPSESVEDFASGCWFSPGSTTLIRRAAFDQVGLQDEALRRLEDLDWFLRFALQGGQIITLPEITVNVQVGGKPNVDKVDQSVAQMKDKWLNSEQKNVLTPKVRRKLCAYLALEQASCRFHAQNYIGFMRYLLASFFFYPRKQIPIKNWWNNLA